MSGSDSRMDQRGNMDFPVNPLPTKFQHCSFPDLDFIPAQYLLSKGTASPVDMALAEVGNFFIRERAKRILELAVPGACQFYPTYELKTKKPTPWFLAVPVKTIRTDNAKPSIPRCPVCGEPKVAHPGSQCVSVKVNCAGVDVFKSLNWSSSESTQEQSLASCNRYRKADRLPPLKWSDWGLEAPTHSGRWTRSDLDRELYFSVRLEELLKKAKIKGFVRSMGYDERPSRADLAWGNDKLELLAKHGLAEVKPEKPGPELQKWFRSYLKLKALKKSKAYDFTAVEKKQKITLPQSYKDFFSMVGPKTFRDVDEQEGFTAHILPPEKLDFKDCRRGALPDLDEESAAVDGVVFADTEHGDAFVFDISSKNRDFPVFLYEHEMNSLEPYAHNFAECIKRFVEGS
jgi:SMI1 / KNR4 family (SUKH-1)